MRGHVVTSGIDPDRDRLTGRHSGHELGLLERDAPELPDGLLDLGLVDVPGTVRVEGLAEA